MHFVTILVLKVLVHRLSRMMVSGNTSSCSFSRIKGCYSGSLAPCLIHLDEGSSSPIFDFIEDGFYNFEKEDSLSKEDLYNGGLFEGFYGYEAF